MRKRDVHMDLSKMAEILLNHELLIHFDLNLNKTFPIVQMPLTLDEYVENILKANHYTFLLYDGSSIQVGYRFNNLGLVTSHKLVFFFSPLSLPALRHAHPGLGKNKLKEFIEIGEPKEGIIDILTSPPNHLEAIVHDCGKVASGYKEEFWQKLTWIYGIRLDYNGTAANSANHPQSHATIFDGDCRIAVSNYFDLRRFFLLIFAHLWPFHKTELVPKIRQKIPPRSRAQNLIPTSYPSDYGAFLSF